MRILVTLTLASIFVGMSNSGESPLHGNEGTGLAELAEPAGFTVGGVQHGIASKYTRDAGLTDDPDVILFEDFEVDSIAALDAKGWVPRHGPGLWKDGTGEKLGWKYCEIRGEAGTPFAGNRCLKKSITSIASDPPSQPVGAKATWDLPDGRTLLFVRAYVKLSSSLPSEGTSFRILGVTGVPDGQPTYQTFGANTPRSDGTGPFWVDLKLFNMDRYNIRHLRIDCKKTDTHYVLYGSEGRLPANRWLCIEMKVKLNAPGKRDGELRVWLDGKEVFRHPRMWYRNTDAVKIRSVHDQFRIDQRRFTSGGHFWVDNLVVARSYIGPAVDKPLQPSPPTLFPAPDKEAEHRPALTRTETLGGIATRYSSDAGIENDPDVIFVENFEDSNWDKRWQERSGAHRNYGSLETDPDIVLSGENSLKLLFKPEAGPGGAGWMHYWYDGSDVAYLRYYFRLSDGGDWRNQKIMQLHGHKPGVRYGRGAGNRGIDWLCAGDGVGGQEGPPWRKNILYNYHPHQSGGFGDNLEPTTSDVPAAVEGRWICKEFMVKLNDPEKLNGEVRKWVDGRLVIEKTDMEWRLEPDIVINNIMQPTYTLKPPGPGQERILWLDNIVLAKRYIGPMATVDDK